MEGGRAARAAVTSNPEAGIVAMLTGMGSLSYGEQAAEMKPRLDAPVLAPGAIKTAAEAGFAHDMMPEAGNAAGEALVMEAVNALIDQTRSIERVVFVLKLERIAFEGSGSLDNPSAVFR